VYYRDFTSAAPMAQREIDLAQTKATNDALAVYKPGKARRHRVCTVGGY
jgi:hypothetical protein